MSNDAIDDVREVIRVGLGGAMSDTEILRQVIEHLGGLAYRPRGEEEEIRPVWISRERAEDAGLETVWDESPTIGPVPSAEARAAAGELEPITGREAVPAGTPFQLMALVLLPVGANEYDGFAAIPRSKIVYTNVTPDARIIGAAERLGRRLFEEKL